jgi:hypothetical protein
MVNLLRVAGKDNFTPLADAGQNGLDNMRAEILALIADNKLPGNASAPDIRQGFQLDFAAAQKIINGGIRPNVLVTEEFQVVVNRLHPRPDLFFFIPRQIPQVIAQGHDGPGDQQSSSATPAGESCLNQKKAREKLPGLLRYQIWRALGDFQVDNALKAFCNCLHKAGSGVTFSGAITPHCKASAEGATKARE